MPPVLPLPVTSPEPARTKRLRSTSVASAQRSEKGITSCKQLTDSTRYGPAQLTPQHPLTFSELRLLNKPGDTVITVAGDKVRIVQDEEGRVFFESSQRPCARSTEFSTMSPEAMASAEQAPAIAEDGQITPMSRVKGSYMPSLCRKDQYRQSSIEQTSRKSSTSFKSPARKKRTGGVTRLTAIDTKNIIGLSDGEDEESTVAGMPHTSPAPTSSYSLRNRTARQSALRYDLKYHPMDDSIRPTQAAKRREAHGEVQLFADDDNESFSVRADSEKDSDVGGDDEEETKPEPVKKGKKHARRDTRSLEPTRRSSRRSANVKVSYDMSVHPQDHDLIVIASDSEEVEEEDDRHTSTHVAKRKKLSHTSVAKTKCRTKPSSVAVVSSDGSSHDVRTSGVESDNDRVEIAPTDVPEIVIKTSSPVSPLGTPSPASVRWKEGLDVRLQPPNEPYFGHNRDSWPTTPGMLFQIHVDSLEDHLAVEAKAASPLNFDHDDKENDETNQEINGSTIFLDSMSIMSASQRRRTSEDSQTSRDHSLVRGAFFAEHTDVYGLGSDGTQEESRGAADDISVSEAMSVLISGEQLPRGPTINVQADDVDSVMGLSCGTGKGDSVLGSDVTI